MVNIQNSEFNEQLALINQLDDDEKNTLIKIINSMLTKKRMKDLLDGKIKLTQKQRSPELGRASLFLLT